MGLPTRALKLEEPPVRGEPGTHPGLGDTAPLQMELLRRSLRPPRSAAWVSQEECAGDEGYRWVFCHRDPEQATGTLPGSALPSGDACCPCNCAQHSEVRGLPPCPTFDVDPLSVSSELRPGKATAGNSDGPVPLCSNFYAKPWL